MTDDTLPRMAEAVALLESRDWQAAHEIVQSDSSALGSWAHGIVHLIEGDISNAGYWYRKADRALDQDADLDTYVSAEIAALRAAIQASSASQ